MADDLNVVHVGEIGKIFRFFAYEKGVIRPLSSFTAGRIHFEAPDGTITTQTATLTTVGGADGAFEYETDAAGDISVGGPWHAQGEWDETAKNFYTPRVPFTVSPVLA